jgi:hypothetical protein
MSIRQLAVRTLSTPGPADDQPDDQRAMGASSIRLPRGRGWWLPGVAALGGVALFLLVRQSLTDDGYITLDYARNLAVHGEWGLVAGAPANSATSPLNILLLGFLTFLTRVVGAAHPVVALGMLNVLASSALGWSWMRLMRSFRLPVAAAVVGTFLVLVNPFVLSATGLEVLLVPAVLMLLTVFAVEGRRNFFAVTAGLTVLTRLDLVVFVILIALSAAAIRRELVRVVALAIVVAGPWYVFSWFAFGSFVPDTLVIKQAQSGLFGVWGYFTGPVMYFMSRPIVVLLTFGPALAGLFALVGWLGLRFAVRWKDFPSLGPVAALGFGGVVYYVVYSFLGVGPYHWYYVAPVVTVGAFAVVSSGVWLSYSREQPRTRSGPPLVVLGVVAALTLSNLAVDAEQGVPWSSPVIFGNWASAQDYAKVAPQIGRRLDGATVASPGEIGALAYFCGCTILDQFSDRGQVSALVNTRIDSAGPLMRLALKVNYHWFDRSRLPRKADYRLLYGPGPAVGPDSWQVYSAAKGVGHFTLVAEG